MQFELRRFLKEDAASDDNRMTYRVHWGAVLCAALLVVGAVASVPVSATNTDESTTNAASADENEAPLADAGLDQEVPLNSTVYLDASGSRDPDGSIASYEWSIDRPDGTPTSPRCETCAQSEFRAGMVGTYEVTVTVTDDDGATRSDTLYVTVTDVDGPNVGISGPGTVTAGTNVTFVASATAGDEPLMRLDWATNGSETASEDLRGPSATDELERRFDPGTYELSVEVVSELGRTDTAQMVVEVTANASGEGTDTCSEATWNLSQGGWDTSGCDSSSTLIGDLGTDDGGSGTACSRYGRDDDFYCNNDRLLYGNSQNIIIHDADNDGEVTVFGKTLSVDLSNSGMGRSYTMTAAEFKEKFDVDTVRPLDVQNASQRGRNKSSTIEVVQGGGDSGGTGGNSDEENETSACEHVPSRYRTNCS